MMTEVERFWASRSRRVGWRVRGRKMRAHRHRCDNPPCVNPAHLYEGDHQTNSDDKVRAQRQMRGSRYGGSRLTEADVEQIIRLYRAGGVTHRQLSQRFGVSGSQISLMINGKSWRHVYASLEQVAS